MACFFSFAHGEELRRCSIKTAPVKSTTPSRPVLDFVETRGTKCVRNYEKSEIENSSNRANYASTVTSRCGWGRRKSSRSRIASQNARLIGFNVLRSTCWQRLKVVQTLLQTSLQHASFATQCAIVPSGLLRRIPTRRRCGVDWTWGAGRGYLKTCHRKSNAY